MNISVIIPAFNEADYLPSTLDTIRGASAHLQARTDVDVEVIVVDNNSADETAAIAKAAGATVVDEPVQGIGRARNRGANVAAGDVLIFVDADVAVPKTLLEAIHEAMSDPTCIGGGMDVEYRPRRQIIRLYLRAWRQLARLTGMVQGATQFCRKSSFESIGGYGVDVWMGEDVDFFWSLKKFAKETRRNVQVVRTPKVIPSTRRFDKLPVWKVLLFTNPFFIILFRRWKAVWTDWYKRPVR